MADINSLINTIRTGVYGSDIREAIADALLILSKGSAGWTSEQISYLDRVFDNLKYSDESTGQNAATSLIASLRNTQHNPTPDPEPEPPTDDTSNYISGNKLYIRSIYTGAIAGSTLAIGD